MWQIFRLMMYFFLILLSACKDSNLVDGEPPGITPVFPPIDEFPAWSPDGSRIMYNHHGIIEFTNIGSYRINPDSAGLWMINTDGTDPHLILKGIDINADWSPGGNWIVFEQGAQIYKVPVVGDSVDTKKIIQLTSGGRNFFPAWSPDGEWIAYRRSYAYPEPMDVQGIWNMRYDGSNRRQIFQGNSGDPNWHPDGIRLIFFRGVINSSGNVLGDSLWVYDVQRQTLATLMFRTGHNRYPRYSPDGAKIVFQSTGNREGGIFIIDSDGSNLQKLIDNGTQPSWSPDGKKIVYVQWFKGGDTRNGTLWIMDEDGSCKRQLTFFNSSM